MQTVPHAVRNAQHTGSLALGEALYVPVRTTGLLWRYLSWGAFGGILRLFLEKAPSTFAWRFFFSPLAPSSLWNSPFQAAHAVLSLTFYNYEQTRSSTGWRDRRRRKHENQTEVRANKGSAFNWGQRTWRQTSQRNVLFLPSAVRS